MTRFIQALLFILVLGCSSNKTLTDSVRKQPKTVVPAPGVLWLKDNLYIDETEVTNFHYLEYYFWTLRNRPQKINGLLLDTARWVNDNYGTIELLKYYHRHPVYRDYPVVGISYEQAVDYCEWRTNMVNCLLYNRQKGEKKFSFDSTFDYPKQVLYRLPTLEEWTFAAHAGLDTTLYPLGYVNLTSKQGKPINFTQEYYNLFQRPQIPFFIARKSKSTRPCPTNHVKFGGVPNKYGLYNLIGNVSELVLDSLVVGLNFKTTLDGKPIYEKEYKLDEALNYKRPEVWIGFRCVCEILVKE
jgi:formylglycine-generating enzyme required for sulfatase activity